MLNQFTNLSCYEEFEIQCDLIGISKLDILKEIGYQIDDYYFFVSNDGFFNWFDLEGNHVEYPGVLKVIKEKYIPKNITKCVIPDNVKCIGYSAFQECKSLSSITIPDSVTSISGYSFAYCKSLDSITIPDSVKSVGSYVFYNCKTLESITIPNSVTSIGNGVFWGCTSLTSITIPDSVINISDCAFLHCDALKEIIIPDNITHIGYNAFFYCKSLKEVIFKGKTLDEVKQMKYYPFGIEDESIIKCENKLIKV